MQKILLISCACLLLGACGNREIGEPEITSTPAQELLVNEELAVLFPYEVGISLDRRSLLIEAFPENREVIYFKQSVIDAYENGEWVKVVDLGDKFPLDVDYQEMDFPVSSSRRSYDFAWIEEQGFVVEEGLFRVRQRMSFSPDFPEELTHDWVVEFSLDKVGSEITNLDVVGELRFNPEFEAVVLEVERDGDLLEGTIVNQSEFTITPSHPSLEYLDNGDWRYVPFRESIAFVDIAFIIPPGESHNFTLDLSWYEIPDGALLRLRKYVWEDEHWIERERHHDLVWEFEY